MFVLRRISTGEIIHRHVPDETALSVVGLEADLEYLRVVEAARPEYDARLFSLGQVEARSTVAPEWLVTWTTTRRPDAEIMAHIDNAERLHAAEHLRQEEQLKVLTLGLAILFRRVSGLQLTAKEQTLATRIQTAGVAMWKNHDHALALRATLAAGGEPDLDTGWEPAA